VRHAKALLPYLAAAVVIAAGSTALVFATVEGESVPAATADPSRPAPELSPTGRLAYWRFDTGSTTRLWVANLDGSQARPIATFNRSTNPLFNARWTGDGSGVGVIVTLAGLTTSQSFGGAAVVRAGVDGSRTQMTMASDILLDGVRIIDQHWSPQGTSVAVTAFRQRDGKTDVFVGSVSSGGFTQLTRAGNAFASDWLDEDQLLVESGAGSIAVMRPDGSARQLTSVRAVSPVIGEGGRIYYLAGQVAITGEPPSPFALESTIWSIGSDGQDARQERQGRIGGFARLDSRWPDGRFLYHIPHDATQWIIGQQVGAFSTAMVSRVVVSADRRTAICLVRQRILTLEVARATTTPIPASAFRVLLDGVFGADAWARRGGLP
jgi:hypothetical protein